MKRTDFDHATQVNDEITTRFCSVIGMNPATWECGKMTPMESLYSHQTEKMIPYLRPMSSMTEEEDKEWQYYKNKIAESCDELLEERIADCHNFFNSHHLDFRNLIGKGLAIDCTNLNIY